MLSTMAYKSNLITYLLILQILTHINFVTIEAVTLFVTPPSLPRSLTFVSSENREWDQTDRSVYKACITH